MTATRSSVFASVSPKFLGGSVVRFQGRDRGIANLDVQWSRAGPQLTARLNHHMGRWDMKR